jgi:hypothetical protein
LLVTKGTLQFTALRWKVNLSFVQFSDSWYKTLKSFVGETIAKTVFKQFKHDRADGNPEALKVNQVRVPLCSVWTQCLWQEAYRVWKRDPENSDAVRTCLLLASEANLLWLFVDRPLWWVWNAKRVISCTFFTK